MIKFLLAAVMGLALAACSSPGTGPSKPSRGASGKAALPEAPPPPVVADAPIICTADVKQCPDGSYVSRNPDNGCAFNSCPGASKH